MTLSIAALYSNKKKHMNESVVSACDSFKVVLPKCLVPFSGLSVVLTVSVLLSAMAPGMGVAVYVGLVVALLLSVIMVLCVGVLAYRRRCRHLHGDITDSSSALTAAFHPGNYKPPRQGELPHVEEQKRVVLSSERWILGYRIFFWMLVQSRYLSMLLHVISESHVPLSPLSLLPVPLSTTFFTLKGICLGVRSLARAIKY